MTASHSNDTPIQIAQYLLAHGASVNKSSVGGASPLFVACMAGHVELAKILVEVSPLRVHACMHILSIS